MGRGGALQFRFRGRERMQDILTHIYVLVPTLDAEKHYWVGKG